MILIRLFLFITWLICHSLHSDQEISTSEQCLTHKKTTLCSQAALAVLNSDGSPENAIKIMTSKENMQALLSSTLKAGICGSGNSSGNFFEQIVQRGMNNTVGAGLDKLISNKPLDQGMIDAWINAGIDTVAQVCANKIGGLSEDNGLTKDALHFGLGAGTQALSDIAQDKDVNLANALNSGTSAVVSRRLFNALDNKNDTDKQRKTTSDIVKIAVSTMGFLGHQDPNVSYKSALNVLNNDCLMNPKDKFAMEVALNEAMDKALDELVDDIKQSDKPNQPSAQKVKETIAQTPELANAVKQQIVAKAMLEEAARLERMEENGFALSREGYFNLNALNVEGPPISNKTQAQSLRLGAYQMLASVNNGMNQFAKEYPTLASCAAYVLVGGAAILQGGAYVIAFVRGGGFAGVRNLIIAEQMVGASLEAAVESIAQDAQQLGKTDQEGLHLQESVYQSFEKISGVLAMLGLKKAGGGILNKAKGNGHLFSKIGEKPKFNNELTHRIGGSKIPGVGQSLNKTKVGKAFEAEDVGKNAFDKEAFMQHPLMKGKIGPDHQLMVSKYTPYSGGYQKSFVTTQEEIYYRVYSGDNKIGSFLTKVPPHSSTYAKEALSLPVENTAQFIQEVMVPKGVLLQRSRALSAFGKHGGAEQFEVLVKRENLSSVLTFKTGVALK